MNDDLTLDEVVVICSRAHLADGSMTFDSYGSDDVRVVTLVFLYSNGLTLEDAEEVVNNITRNDYFRGPTDHYDQNRRVHKLWEFKKVAFNMMVYIKIIPYNKNRYIAVVSFHEDR